MSEKPPTTEGPSASATQKKSPLLYSNICNAIQDDCNSVFIAYMLEPNPVKQVGPQCGIVALCMALEILRNRNKDSLFNAGHTPNAIYKLAKEMGFTNLGEMFSCEWMSTLALNVYPSCTATVLDSAHLLEQPHRLIDVLLSSQAVLIPYDNDRSNVPCLKRGHSAHWGLVTGYLIKSSAAPSDCCKCLLQDDSLRNLRWLNHAMVDECDYDQCAWIACWKQANLSSKDAWIRLFAMQGNSMYPSLWPLNTLLESNQNLLELDPKLQQDTFRFPDPSAPLEELRSKLVLLM